MPSHPAIVFPADVADLDKEVLTQAISARIPGVVVKDFRILTTKYAGEGVASTADRVVLECACVLVLVTPHPSIQGFVCVTYEYPQRVK